MINEQIFLKMTNNLILCLKRNDWMESKCFSDPEIVFASRKHNIIDIISFKNFSYILTEDGLILSSTKK